MRIERHVVARKDQRLVALPSKVQAHLGLVAGQAVYWHIAQKGRVILTATGHVLGGRPSPSADCPNCVVMNQEIARLRARDVLRERTLYAEGYSAGCIAVYERLRHPGGPSATREQQRRHAALGLPDNAAAARRRRQRAEQGRREAEAAGPEAPPA